MTLSIILPTRNEVSNYLIKCISTLINQSINDYEIIIVCEKDDFNLELIKRLSNEHYIIKYIINSVPGVAGARNLGVSISRGEYIAFADSDDYYDSMKFEAQVKYLNDNPEISVVGSNLYLVDEQNKIIGTRVYPQNHEDIINAFLYNMPIANPSIMLRKSDFVDVGHFDQSFVKAEDFDLWLRFLKQNKQFHNLQEYYVYYRLPNDVFQKRGKVHYVNYAKTLTKNCVNIWPVYKWLLPVIIFNIIKYFPNKILSIFLNTKLIHFIKKISI